jgi:hypothetical protein
MLGTHLLCSTPCIAQSSFRAAYGAVDITPIGPAFMAGYANGRKSIDAHDRLFAHCLVVEKGASRIAFVSVDLIGLPRFEILRIRDLVHSVKPECVIVGATHTHSGPDTLGMWGPVITVSGVDQAWLADVRAKAAHLVDETTGRLQAAGVRFASTKNVGRISKNIRIPKILDTELGVMQVVQKDGSTPIATFVNYACHPEVLNNRHITADFPHWLYQTIEAGGGGPCIYFNGAQGGMITADYDESTAPPGENWNAAETIGRNLGEHVLAVLKSAQVVTSPEITFERRLFSVPLENQRYKTLIAMHVISAAPRADGTFETEVCRVGIGSAEFLTLPGEVLPNVGFYLKSMMHGSPKFLLGLTNDFLGYILTPEDFGLALYEYESGQSVGRHIEPLMIQNLEALINKEPPPRQ